MYERARRAVVSAAGAAVAAFTASEFVVTDIPAARAAAVAAGAAAIAFVLSFVARLRKSIRDRL